jgi:iron uptake system component EfeO
MKSAWRGARAAYAHVEGVVATLFPESHQRLDTRYDEMLAALGRTGDPLAFDAEGIVGMHAVERVLFSDETPPGVAAIEATLPGAVAAVFPSNEADARAFREGLCGRLAADARDLDAMWAPARIDLALVYEGLIRLMMSQRTRVVRASTGEEASRYAQTSMADLRANIQGTTAAYDAFRPWLLSKPSGAVLDAAVKTGLEDLRALYQGFLGDAVPSPPHTWSSEEPSSADRETPFGRLWSRVHESSDLTRDASLVNRMAEGAKVLGLFGSRVQ